MFDPFSDRLDERLHAGLLQQRTVTLRGQLDGRLAGHIAAQLMWLDGSGDTAVELVVDTPGGDLQSAFSVMDTIDLLGVPVHARCTGRVEGSGIGVIAACERRYATAHTQFHLCEPTVEVFGRASDLERSAQHHQHQLAELVARIVAATGRPGEHVEAELGTGRWMDARTAVDYGLIHEISGPRRGQDRPPGSPPMGFGSGI
jgi:ATP-dependent Clp protease protease subunit